METEEEDGMVEEGDEKKGRVRKFHKGEFKRPFYAAQSRVQDQFKEQNKRGAALSSGRRSSEQVIKDVGR